MAQVLSARGVAFDCFEAGSGIGGNWRYGNDNEMSSAYESLHINTSRQMMEYAAYPMPESLPDYPDHRQIAQYFDDFVDHFGLRDRITFRTEVTKVVPVEGDGYAGDLPLPRRRRARDPPLPRRRRRQRTPLGPALARAVLPGRRDASPASSSTRTTTARPTRSSASACWCSASATRPATSPWSRPGWPPRPTSRCGAGRTSCPSTCSACPTDHLTDSPLVRAPLKVQQTVMAGLLRLTQGKVTDYGLPEPDHAVLHAHPTVSQDLLNRLGHGDITVRPNIDRFEGSKVFFTDGSSGEYDVVVYCTGYKVSFPFLGDEVVRAEDNHVELYRRVVHPDHPGLYFLGLIQPLGAIMPLAEAQAEWVGDLVTGVGALPPVAEMRGPDRGVRRGRCASGSSPRSGTPWRSTSTPTAPRSPGSASALAQARPALSAQGRSKTSSVLVAVATDGARLVGDDALGEADARAGLHHGADRGQPAAAGAHRLEVVHLDLDRGVALALRQRAVQRAAGDRVEQGADQAAVDRADRVVRRLVGRAGEHDPARLGLGEVHLDQLRDRRRRDPARRSSRGCSRCRPSPSPASAGRAGSCQVTVRDCSGPQSVSSRVGRRSLELVGHRVLLGDRRRRVRWRWRSGSSGSTAYVATPGEQGVEDGQQGARRTRSGGTRSGPAPDWYCRRSTTPASASALSRAAIRSRGAPVPATMSVKRWAPRASSRTTSSDQRSPTTSRPTRRSGTGDRGGRPG